MVLKTHQRNEFCSYELFLSGAIFQDTPTDLPLPDIARNWKMTQSLCQVRMLCANNGYPSFHEKYINGDA